jgi:thioredoxin 1
MKTITYSTLIIKLRTDNYGFGSLTLVDVFAEWCKPCHRMTPVLELIETEFTAIDVVKIDADDETTHEYMAENKIASIPTLLLYEDGKLLGKWEGGQDIDAIRSWIASIVSVPLANIKPDNY